MDTASLKSIRKTVKPLKVLVLSGRPLGGPLLKEDGVSQDEEEKVLEYGGYCDQQAFYGGEFYSKGQRISFINSGRKSVKGRFPPLLSQVL